MYKRQHSQFERIPLSYERQERIIQEQIDETLAAINELKANACLLYTSVRLPNSAFKANAGTEVVSDIIFLQKRDRPIDHEPDWVQLAKTGDGFSINQYFVDHPEICLLYTSRCV